MNLYFFKPINLDSWSVRTNKYKNGILNSYSSEDKIDLWLLPDFVCQTSQSCLMQSGRGDPSGFPQDSMRYHFEKALVLDHEIWDLVVGQPQELWNDGISLRSSATAGDGLEQPIVKSLCSAYCALTESMIYQLHDVHDQKLMSRIWLKCLHLLPIDNPQYMPPPRQGSSWVKASISCICVTSN